MELYTIEISITNSKERNLTPKSNLFVSNLSRTRKENIYFQHNHDVSRNRIFQFRLIELYPYYDTSF